MFGYGCVYAAKLTHFMHMTKKKQLLKSAIIVIHEIFFFRKSIILSLLCFLSIAKHLFHK